jgi:hypothetical protein
MAMHGHGLCLRRTELFHGLAQFPSDPGDSGKKSATHTTNCFVDDESSLSKNHLLHIHVSTSLRSLMRGKQAFIMNDSFV